MMATEGITAHDPDAEFRVIAAIFFDPPLGAKVIGRGLASESFYKCTHRLIFAAIEAATAKGEEPDETAVEVALVESGDFESVGGREGINQFSTNEKVDPLAAAAQWKYYASCVQKCADQRFLSRSLIKAKERADAGDVDGARQVIGEIQIDPLDLAGKSSLVTDTRALFESEGMAVPRPQVGTIEGGGCLLYLGRLNEVHAEPGVGKSNINLSIAADVIRNGGRVLFIDPEDNWRGAVGRLVSFGLSIDQALDNFDYVSFDPTRWGELYALCESRKYDLVSFDGLAAGMQQHDLDENSVPDTIQFLKMFSRIQLTVAAVLISDHVIKDKDGRGRWPRGSGAKLGQYDGAVYWVELGKSYGPETEHSEARSGFVRLKVAKDRNGGVGPVGMEVAEIHFNVTGFKVTPDPRNPEEQFDLFDVSIIKPAPCTDEVTGEFRPTTIMAKIKDYLEANPGATKSDLKTRGESRYVRDAINILLREGDIRIEKGPKNASLHYLVEKVGDQATSTV